MAEQSTWQWCREAAVLSGSKEKPYFYLCKRLIDLILASFLLVLLLPLLALIAILIKLHSPGPIIFVQDRVGARRRPNGGRKVWEIRTFPFYKFRSMYQGADQSVHEAHIRDYVEGCSEILKGNGSGATLKLSNDPRVTRVGRILRKTSLDELPQLVNVLKGEMSLVGPRPVPIYEVTKYEDKHFERLAALPGITGLWQVKGRCELPFEEMVRLDVEYVRKASLWLDIKILFQTLPAVLSGRGAE